VVERDDGELGLHVFADDLRTGPREQTPLGIGSLSLAD
jgi:hypothetical protein